VEAEGALRLRLEAIGEGRGGIKEYWNNGIRKPGI